MKTSTFWIFTLLLLFSSFLLMACSTVNSASQAPEHHTETGFKNLHLNDDFEKGFFTFLKMRFFSGETFPDETQLDDVTPRVELESVTLESPGTAPQITWMGHSTFLIQYKGLNILTDPMFSERASPVSFAGPKRYTPVAMGIEDLPPIDYIVISHDHYDHLDLNSVLEIGSKPMWLVPLGIDSWLENQGILPDRIQSFDWWDSQDYGTLKVTATPSQHFSGRSLWDRFETLWAAWALDIGGYKVWFGGDTGYNDVQFKEIGTRLGPFDLGLIPIGAYAPRWFMKAMHVNPTEAVEIHQDIKARYSIGIHWGTFVLTSEPVDEPPIALQKALEDKQLPPESFQVLKVGETQVL